MSFKYGKRVVAYSCFVKKDVLRNVIDELDITKWRAFAAAAIRFAKLWANKLVQ